MKTRVVTVDPRRPDAAAIADAAAVIRAGGLVAFPTETVYGLGAHALDAEAVARIFAAKGRPSTDPVIVHLEGAAQMAQVARSVPDLAHRLATRFWPGPLTLILPKAASVPDAVTAGLPSVGVRVPAHPVAQALLHAAGLPVAAPSANRFARPSPTEAAHVLADLDGVIDMVIDAGATPIGVESTILDLTVTPPRMRRPGGVSFEELVAIVPDMTAAAEHLPVSAAQPAPGQLTRHYAPRAMLTLYVGSLPALASRLGDDARHLVAGGQRVGILAPEEDLLALAPRLAAAAAGGRLITARCGSREDRRQAAHDLFRALRALDDAAVDVILAATPPGGAIDAAIIDRLTRAAEGRVIVVP